VVSSTPRPHFTRGKDPIPILQEAGWVQGPVWTGGKSRPHRDSISDRPARSHSLYRLSYPPHLFLYIFLQNVCSRSTDVAVSRRVVATFRPMLHETPLENLYFGIFLYFGPVKRPLITRGYSDYCLNNPRHVILLNVWTLYACVW